MTSGQVMGRSRDVPLYKAQTWIQDNASRPIGVRDVAQAAAISERTLGRLFQRHLGQTPASFMREVRIKRAQMWLEGPGAPRRKSPGTAATTIPARSAGCSSARWASARSGIASG